MKLITFGKANAGQLGLSEKVQDHYDKPVFVEGNIWVKVKCGGYHTAALSANGNLFVWGAGWNGQLGLGKSVQKQFVPRPISILEEGTVITKVACGTSHTVVITVDKKVFSWGGDSGDAGLRQIQVPNGVIMKSVTAGNAFTVAVAIDGEVYSWGTGMDGRLGVGSTRNFRNPQKVTFPSSGSEQVRVMHVSAGKAHCLALTASKQVFSWGCGAKGQLGNGSTEDQLGPIMVSNLQNIVRIATGESHSVALTGKGVVYAWGDGEHGQIGLPNVPVQNEPAVVSTLPEEVKIMRIGAGQYHTLAVSEYGDVFSWGDNSFGQLGTGDTTSSNSAMYLDTMPEDAFAAKVVAGERHSVVIVTEYNRFDKINESKYRASLLPPPKPVRPVVAEAEASGSGGGGIMTPNITTQRKSMRRSVKFNLESAFAQMEGEMLALEDEDGGDNEEIIEENDGISPKKRDEVIVNMNGNNNGIGSSGSIDKKEGDPIFKDKKGSWLSNCGCVIL